MDPNSPNLFSWAPTLKKCMFRVYSGVPLLLETTIFGNGVDTKTFGTRLFLLGTVVSLGTGGSSFDLQSAAPDVELLRRIQAQTGIVYPKP